MNKPDLPQDVLELAAQVEQLGLDPFTIAESSAVVFAKHGPAIAGRYCELLDTLAEDGAAR